LTPAIFCERECLQRGVNVRARSCAPFERKAQRANCADSLQLFDACNASRPCLHVLERRRVRDCARGPLRLKGRSSRVYLGLHRALLQRQSDVVEREANAAE
jgi:hypothetical protein